MKNILIVGGSKGIGNAILLQQLENNRVINISRNALKFHTLT
jgi:short-subunit dehydrogenase